MGLMARLGVGVAGLVELGRGFRAGAVVWRDGGRLVAFGGCAGVVAFFCGFCAGFVLAVVAGSVLAFVLKSALSAAGLGPVDRALGAVFGAGRGMLLLLVISAVVAMTPWRDDPAWAESEAAAVADTVLRGLKPWLAPGFSKYLPASLQAG